MAITTLGSEGYKGSKHIKANCEETHQFMEDLLNSKNINDAATKY